MLRSLSQMRTEMKVEFDNLANKLTVIDEQLVKTAQWIQTTTTATATSGNVNDSPTSFSRLPNVPDMAPPSVKPATPPETAVKVTKKPPKGDGKDSV